MLEGLVTRDSFFRAYGEQLFDQILGFFGDMSPVLDLETDLSLFDLLENAGCIFTHERWRAAEQDVHDDSQGPIVAFD